MKEAKENKDFIECECGFRIYGKSESQRNHNLKIHKMSKRHKELMEIKKRRKSNDTFL